MNIFNELNFVLKKSKNDQYGINSIPIQLAETDKTINEILDCYISFQHDEQEQIQTYITVETAWLLLCFGIRMATYSLRQSNQKLFSNGLLALSLAYWVLDERELLVVFSLYCDAQKKNALFFDGAFKRNGKFAMELENFVNRKDVDKSIESMGYILEFDSENIPTYKKTW